MSKIKKKNLLLLFLAGIFAVLVYVNHIASNRQAFIEENDNPLNAELVNSQIDETKIMNGTEEIKETFFEDYRLQREKTREENIETLNEITEDENASSESKNEAQKAKMELVKRSEQELRLENMIKAKGYDDCILFIHEQYVNVVVDASEIAPNEAVQIQDIVKKECNMDLSKITIAVSKKGGTPSEEQKTQQKEQKNSATLY